MTPLLLQLPLWGAGADLSLLGPAMRRRRWNKAASGEVQVGHEEKVPHPEVAQCLNRLCREAVTAPSSGSIWTTLSPHDLILGGPVRSRVLDSVILMDPLQLELFWDSMLMQQPRSLEPCRVGTQHAALPWLRAPHRASI